MFIHSMLRMWAYIYNPCSWRTSFIRVSGSYITSKDSHARNCMFILSQVCIKKIITYTWGFWQVTKLTSGLSSGSKIKTATAFRVPYSESAPKHLWLSISFVYVWLTQLCNYLYCFKTFTENTVALNEETIIRDPHRILELEARHKKL